MKKGKRYAELAKLVDRTTTYEAKDAVSLVKKLANAKFDETIEAHWCSWRGRVCPRRRT